MRDSDRFSAIERLLAVALPVLCLLASVGCSRQTNTLLLRQWEAFNTRFNVYHNGETHFREQLDRLESEYVDDYSQPLPVFPASVRGDERFPQPEGDFSRTIEKMQKAIELHSIARRPVRRNDSPEEKAFRSRSEYNPFLHKAWMLLGEALFQKGDFVTAAETFRYIARHFSWLPAYVTEARLREALAWSAADRIYEAENALRPVKQADLLSKELESLNAQVRADLAVRTHRPSEAVAWLECAIPLVSGRQRHRLLFLKGQMLTAIDSTTKAFEAFRLAGRGHGVPRALKINSRIRQSESASSTALISEIKELMKMMDYEANKDFRGQLAYAAANLHLTRRDTTSAIRELTNALALDFPSPRDRALAQLTLGKIYYSKGNFLQAQPLFSSALLSLPSARTDYQDDMQILESLNDYSVYARAYNLQDSLLVLAEMSPDDRMKTARRLAEEERRRLERKHDVTTAEGETPELVSRPMSGLPAPLVITAPTDNAWYFYNPRLREAGKLEFQKVWGLRKLEDDWRWGNKNGIGSYDSFPETSPLPSDSVSFIQTDYSPIDPEWYLATIPGNEDEIRKAENIIMESLFNMGEILQDQLNRPTLALNAYDELERRFPHNPYKEQIDRNRQLLALRNNPQEMERLRKIALRQDSLYERTYNAYLEGDYTAVDEAVLMTEREWNYSPLLPRMLFLQALGALAQGDVKIFSSLLGRILVDWPDVDIAPLASSIVRSMSEGRVPQITHVRPLKRIFSEGFVVSSESDSVASLPFTADPNEKHIVAIAFSPDSVNANQVLFEVARFNFSTFAVQDHELSLQKYPSVAFVTIRDFKTREDADRYVARLLRGNVDLPSGVRPVILSVHDYNLMVGSGYRLEEYLLFSEP